MRALVIGESQRKNLKALEKFASQNVVSIQSIVKMSRGELPSIGDNPKFSTEIPVGFRVVFSYEDQLVRRLRHLSVSVDGNKYPSPESIQMIMAELGFRCTDLMNSEELKVWIEKEVRAVNVVERV